MSERWLRWAKKWILTFVHKKNINFQKPVKLDKSKETIWAKLRSSGFIIPGTYILRVYTSLIIRYHHNYHTFFWIVHRFDHNLVSTWSICIFVYNTGTNNQPNLVCIRLCNWSFFMLQLFRLVKNLEIFRI